MSRLPIRARLTAAFALATMLVLAAAGLFVYARLEADLDEEVDLTLRARADAVASTGEPAAGAPGEADEGFAQVQRGGSVMTAGGARGRVEAPPQGRFAEREVAGVEGTARLLAARGAGGAVVVVGQSLDDRDETLSGLVASFAIGGPVAVLLASLLGYGLATAGLRPVEAMRRRAGEISLAREGERLPLPAADDEVRRLGETLNEMLARLHRSFERERRFVADASHELRTPLAVIKAELEGALRAGGHDPEVRAALEAALDECDGLARLAEDLLVLARSTEDGLPLRPEPVAAEELLEGVRARFAERAARAGRAVAVDVLAADADAEPPGAGSLTVIADPLRLQQALGNLVDNALRHGAGDVTLSAHRADGALVLEVADEGPGFPPELAGRAFERFARGDPARTGDGAGLGLAIVQAIADAHGGRAELGEGARVRIVLPSQGRLRAAP